MAFTVAALVLGGFTLYNLSSSSSSFWALDPQQRLEKVAGQKHANINLAQMMSHWQPVFDPKNDKNTETMYRRFKIQTDTISQDPVKNLRGQANMQKYNYRQGRSYAIGPQRNLDIQYG